MDTMPEIDRRIHALSEEVNHLRKARHTQGGEVQKLTLGHSEIQLTLAQQDKSLARIIKLLEGNGQPGIVNRMDMAERAIGLMQQSSRISIETADRDRAQAIHDSGGMSSWLLATYSVIGSSVTVVICMAIGHALHWL